MGMGGTGGGYSQFLTGIITSMRRAALLITISTSSPTRLDFHMTYFDTDDLHGCTTIFPKGNFTMNHFSRSPVFSLPKNPDQILLVLNTSRQGSYMFVMKFTFISLIIFAR